MQFGQNLLGYGTQFIQYYALPFFFARNSGAPKVSETRIWVART